MESPYMASIILFGGNFAPRDWAFCEGQVISIPSNTALFSLIGTTYGGNGQTTFRLPDMRGRVPIGAGRGNGLGNYVLGEMGGMENATLELKHLSPQTLKASVASPEDSAAVGVFVAGGNQPHNNLQPSLGLNFIIAVRGYYPPRN